jgi:hypothetical protein
MQSYCIGSGNFKLCLRLHSTPAAQHNTRNYNNQCTQATNIHST